MTRSNAKQLDLPVVTVHGQEAVARRIGGAVCYPFRVEVRSSEVRVDLWLVRDEHELPEVIECTIEGAGAVGPSGLDKGIWHEVWECTIRALLDSEDAWHYFDLSAASEARISRLMEEALIEGVAKAEVAPRVADRVGAPRYDATAVTLQDLVVGRQPPRRDDELFFAEVAKLYVDCDHSPARVRNELAERGEYWSDSTIRQWIFKAREKGLLSEAPSRGHGGGELTDRGRALLDPPHGPVDPAECERGPQPR
jgi:hypothetical protein